MDFRKIFTGICLLFIYLTQVSVVYAVVTPPIFPSCINPQGTTIAHYASGKHGIVGGSEQKGSDNVYKLSETTYMQCFCPSNGLGIQTNWWNVSSLDQSDIANLQNNGWIYQPQGLYWGLTNASYLGQNSSFSCNNQITAIVAAANASDTNSGNTTANPGSTSSTSTGSVPQLANTGNSVLLYGLIILGSFSILAGLLIKKISK